VAVAIMLADREAGPARALVSLANAWKTYFSHVCSLIGSMSRLAQCFTVLAISMASTHLRREVENVDEADDENNTKVCRGSNAE